MSAASGALSMRWAHEGGPRWTRVIRDRRPRGRRDVGVVPVLEELGCSVRVSVVDDHDLNLHPRSAPRRDHIVMAEHRIGGSSHARAGGR